MGLIPNVLDAHYDEFTAPDEQFPSNPQGGGYNPADQLTNLTGLLGFVYGRDRLGQQESTHSYGYDALNRLTSDQQPNHSTTWSYDVGDELTGIIDSASSLLALSQFFMA